MVGNVAEWVNDWYASRYYKRLIEFDPQGPEQGNERVVRGGSWISRVSSIRSSDRRGVNPLRPYNYIGFRCAYDTDDLD